MELKKGERVFLYESYEQLEYEGEVLGIVPFRQLWKLVGENETSVMGFRKDEGYRLFLKEEVSIFY